MQLYTKTDEFTLYQGSMLDMLQVIAPCSIDSIVTDPPYELNFMNKGWDNSGIAFQAETWRKCYQVLKSGGYLLAFGGSRTFHRIACAIEDAGFEIRDTIMWLYGSGFPKSMNIGKAVEAKVLTGSANTQEFKNLQGTKAVADNLGFCRQQFQQGARPNDYTADGHYRTVDVDYQTAEGKRWDGWGTALKPAYEPIIVARKPCEGSCVDNVMQYGTGGLNIDGCRIGTDLIKGGTTPDFRDVGKKSKESIGIDKLSFGQVSKAERVALEDHIGRFPSNVILTYDETDKAEVCGGMPEGGQNGSLNKEYATQNSIYGADNRPKQPFQAYADEGSAARYFYCAKASKRDRDEGLGKEFDSLELILYCCDNGGTEIWKEKITTKEENPAMPLTDMAASMQKAIAEFGMQMSIDRSLNMFMFGNSILAKYLKENKYITKMGISSITGSKILNLLMPYTTKDYIRGANCEMEYGLSLVESAVSSNLLTITIQEKMALVRGAKPVVFKMQFRINEKEKHSSHPTVKPVDLMQYLVRLVTPPSGTVLDPFNGSGSTGKAAMYENKDRNAGYKYIGIELTAEYLPIADARIRYAAGDNTPIEQPDIPAVGQITIFDVLGGTQ